MRRLGEKAWCLWISVQGLGSATVPQHSSWTATHRYAGLSCSAQCPGLTAGKSLTGMDSDRGNSFLNQSVPPLKFLFADFILFPLGLIKTTKWVVAATSSQVVFFPTDPKLKLCEMWMSENICTAVRSAELTQKRVVGQAQPPSHLQMLLPAVGLAHGDCSEQQAMPQDGAFCSWVHSQCKLQCQPESRTWLPPDNLTPLCTVFFN